MYSSDFYKPFLNKLETAKTFYFKFKQTYISADKTDSLIENGRVYYKNNFWRWDYEGIDKRSFFIIGDEIFEKDEDGTEKLNLTKEQFNQSIVRIIENPITFINSHLKKTEKNRLIILGGGKDNFSKVEIRFKSGKLVGIRIIGKNADIIDIFFKIFKFNIKIDNMVFNLEK